MSEKVVWHLKNSSLAVEQGKPSREDVLGNPVFFKGDELEVHLGVGCSYGCGAGRSYQVISFAGVVRGLGRVVETVEYDRTKSQVEVTRYLLRRGGEQIFLDFLGRETRTFEKPTTYDEWKQFDERADLNGRFDFFRELKQLGAA